MQMEIGEEIVNEPLPHISSVSNVQFKQSQDRHANDNKDDKDVIESQSILSESIEVDYKDIILEGQELCLPDQSLDSPNDLDATDQVERNDAALDLDESGLVTLRYVDNDLAGLVHGRSSDQF